MEAKKRNKLIEGLKSKKWVLFGGQHIKKDGKTFYMHIYNRPGIVQLCGEDKVYQLGFHIHKNQSEKKITSEADYHGWVDFEKNKELSMVWPSQVQSDMCFPYGWKAEEDKDRGLRVRLEITVIGLMT